MKIFLLLLVVVSITCAPFESSESSTEEDSSPSGAPQECEVNYKYTIWIGDQVDESYSIELESPCGTLFIDAMYQAAAAEEQFAFGYTAHPLYGAFITQINGVSNDDETNSYWMIYDLSTDPDVDNTPGDEYLSPVGVSSLEVLDGRSYLFWFRTVAFVANEQDKEN